MAHVRELANQITEVYRKITNFSDIKVANLCEDDAKWAGHHIIVTTLGFLKKVADGRKFTTDFSDLKVIVVDEADIFFGDERNFRDLELLNNKYFSKINSKIQWILFSATYPDEISDRIYKIVKDASSI